MDDREQIKILTSLMFIFFLFSFNAFALEELSSSFIETNDLQMKSDTLPTRIAPRFPGCEDLLIDDTSKDSCATQKMNEYIYGKLIYPEQARKNGIEGIVVIQFVVDIDGSISDIIIARNIEGGCGEAVYEIVESMNSLPEKWTPGYQDGKVVKVKYTLPITFKLEGTKKKRKTFFNRKKRGK